MTEQDQGRTESSPGITNDVVSLLDSMSDEDLVGQLLCTYQRGPLVNEFLDDLERHGIRPGGFFMAGGSNTDGTRERVAALASWSRVPPMVAANLESGSSTFALDGELLANPLQVAATSDSRYAELLGRQCANLAHQMGINWSFAPVVDVNYNPLNPITGVRTFGSDPDVVRDHSVAYISAIQSSGVAACAKHWPGDGVDSRDQHLVTSVNHLTEQEWEQGIAAVYRGVVDEGVLTVMAGHIAAPGLLGLEHPDAFLPASQNHQLLEGRLRGQLGFQGLVVSDNTLMAGFTRAMPRDEAVVTAVNAGCDMLLGADYLHEDFDALARAVDSGRLSRDRLREAVGRVLTLKHTLDVLAQAGPRPAPDEAPTKWRSDLARESVTLTKDVEQTLPITAHRYPAILMYVLGDEPTFYQPAAGLADRFADGLRTRGMSVTVRQVPGEGRTVRTETDLQSVMDLVVYFANVPFASNANTSRITWSYPQGPEAPRVAESRSLLISVADPFHLQDVPSVGTALNGYTPSIEVVDAILASVCGEQDFRGVSPVDPFVGYPDAAHLKPRAR